MTSSRTQTSISMNQAACFFCSTREVADASSALVPDMKYIAPSPHKRASLSPLALHTLSLIIVLLLRISIDIHAISMSLFIYLMFISNTERVAVECTCWENTPT